MANTSNKEALRELRSKIDLWAMDEGFSKAGVTDLELDQATNHLRHWLSKNYQADMNWIKDRLDLRENPSQLCLLYTSPSPRDRQKSRMPSSA